MFRKIELWVVALLFVIFLIVLICYGAILREELKPNKTRDWYLQKIALHIAEIPKNTRDIIFSRLVLPDKHANKPRFKRFIQTEREELLLLARHNGDLKRGVVEIVDLNGFSVLHTFKPDFDEINNQTDTSRIVFKKLKTDNRPDRYLMKHPILLNNGDLVFHSDSPLVKIDYCSKLLWVNDNNNYHHSNNIDHEGNYWVPSRMYPYAVDKEIVSDQYGKYIDDSIAKISPNGKILYQKSVSQILIEHGYKSLIFGIDSYYRDPIHLNDIEPALNDGPFWNRGDVFLSLRDRSLILHYRPQSNQLINLISGPFLKQHDVDIISDKEISIFNNNNINTFRGDMNLSNSEVVIYNFENNQFSQKFANSMAENNVITETQGLSDILKDGSLMVEEQNYGRILFFNSEGKLEWEFINKAANNKIYFVSWSRIIDDIKLINNIKEIIQNTTCSN